MGSVTQNIFSKIFRGQGSSEAKSSRESGERARRHSSGFKEFMRLVGSKEEPCFLDLGTTSATNISILSERGCKIYTEDLLGAAMDPDMLTTSEDGSKQIDVERFLKENLPSRGQVYDAVFFWDVADYLPEALVKPVIERVWTTMKPGGVLLAFFHTKDAGPNAQYSRYHIGGDDVLEIQPVQVRNGNGLSSFVKLQRVFNNRHIENLFHDFGSLKFFLARDNIREVLVIR